ncbi:hypothetical protein ASPFODRAFT_57432 [Aspergillus luchuensis CBS 106.47]|uniref:Uncharacterized protein n=1 Tax=Aspergillus luchuensis (strain CBS 106.47) TaxID=1137211 RepID=A0A1M3TX12_ASPLC|nr:hypothetical protein ASPFODRAFT_57432 [Aspergillus luchuensis CBS 106.47]
MCCATGVCDWVNLDNYDNSEQRSRVLGRTEKEYNRTLGFFDNFLELYPEALYLLDLRTYKGFIEFAVLYLYCDYNMPVHISKIIKDFILNSLKEIILLCEDEMPKNYFLLNDLMIVLTYFWCCDFKEYYRKYPDRSQVQFSTSLLLYCFTSARTREVYESTACQELSTHVDDGDDNNDDLKACVLVVCYKINSIKMLVLTYSCIYIKEYWKKKKWQLLIYGFYKIYKKEISLFFNLLIFFLSIVYVDYTFINYISICEIMDTAENIQNNKDKKIIIKLDFRLEIEDTFIF